MGRQDEAKGKTALLVSAERWSELQQEVSPDFLFVLGRKSHLDEVAHNLFHAFRECDREEVDTIFIEAFPDLGLGEALMNRIEKAAHKE